MAKPRNSSDWELARQLQNEMECFGVTENAVFPREKRNDKYQPRTLIDQTLELIDPTPNIHTLFVQFDQKYFWNKLRSVEVKWSNRMTSCAGICTFSPRSRYCIISLSAPLLKLRPRKDLIETLLHEMIHGYLFLTNNNRDRDGHGPEFQKHMKRINQKAGTNITIYHDFHAEVKLYQQHWWRCSGPCHKRPPYFGMVRRASNRAPSKNDFWWNEHKLTCGGEFIKVREPEKPIKSKKKKTSDTINPSGSAGMSNWLIKTGDMNTGSKISKDKANISDVFKKPKISSNGAKTLDTDDSNYIDLTSSNSKKCLNGIKKLGNSTNNVHGWGTAGPSKKQDNSQKAKPTNASSKSKFYGSGTLGGSNSGKSNLLDKFLSPSQSNVAPSTPHREMTSKSNKIVLSGEKNNTLDKFFTPSKKNVPSTFQRNSIPGSSSKNNLIDKFITFSPYSTQRNEIRDEKVPCPICEGLVSKDIINQHLDSCLVNDSSKSSVSKPSSTSSTIIINDNDDDSTRCPVCDTSLKLKDVNGHLDHCLKAPKNSLKRVSSEVFEIPDSPECTAKKMCLVCNSVIPPGFNLNDHLEDCIGEVFDDETIVLDKTEDDLEEVNKKSETFLENKFPCPVCMEMIDEALMNNHLDNCLINS